MAELTHHPASPAGGPTPPPRRRAARTIRWLAARGFQAFVPRPRRGTAHLADTDTAPDLAALPFGDEVEVPDPGGCTLGKSLRRRSRHDARGRLLPALPRDGRSRLLHGAGLFEALESDPASVEAVTGQATLALAPRLRRRTGARPAGPGPRAGSGCTLRRARRCPDRARPLPRRRGQPGPDAGAEAEPELVCTGLVFPRAEWRPARRPPGDAARRRRRRRVPRSEPYVQSLLGKLEIDVGNCAGARVPSGAGGQSRLRRPSPPPRSPPRGSVEAIAGYRAAIEHQSSPDYAIALGQTAEAAGRKAEAKRAFAMVATAARSLAAVDVIPTPI